MYNAFLACKKSLPPKKKKGFAWFCITIKKYFCPPQPKKNPNLVKQMFLPKYCHKKTNFQKIGPTFCRVIH